MATVTVRLNNKETQIIKYLSEYFNEDKASLLKKSMLEMYEDIQDIKWIKEQIALSKKNKPKYITSDELFKDL